MFTVLKEVAVMKQAEDLKDKVEKAKDQEEAKKVIEEAGKELTQDELEQVVGGDDIKIKLPPL